MGKMKENKEKVDFQSLSIGQGGTMVYIVQKIFNKIGYELKEDGIFSEKMFQVVKIFQASRNNLVVDGIVGYQTMKEIDEASNII